MSWNLRLQILSMLINTQNTRHRWTINNSPLALPIGRLYSLMHLPISRWNHHQYLSSPNRKPWVGSYFYAFNLHNSSRKLTTFTKNAHRNNLGQIIFILSLFAKINPNELRDMHWILQNLSNANRRKYLQINLEKTMPESANWVDRSPKAKRNRLKAQIQTQHLFFSNQT